MTRFGVTLPFPDDRHWGGLRARVLGTCIALAGSAVVCGCNIVVDTSTDQCKTTADCSRKGPEFAGTGCSAEKICTRLCTTNSECTDRLGELGYCRPDRICARVRSADCTDVVPEDALSHDDVILAGFMAPVRGPFESQGIPLRQAAELALQEIATNGVPGVDGGPERHLAMLVCHDSPDDQSATQRPFDVARHLVDNLQVPVIIGPSKVPPTVTNVITEITDPARVLTISPSATQPDIPNLERNGLFWRTVPSDAIQADVWRPLGVLVVATLWDTGAVTKPQLPKVVYVARADRYGTSLLERFSDDFATKTPGWSYDLEKQPDWVALAAQIIEARPRVVFAFTTTEFVTELLPRIEADWGSTPAKPYYMLLDGNRVDELLTEVSKNPELGARILGTAPGRRTSALFETFQERFEQAFDRAPGHLAAFAYDATYLLAYAVAGARKQRPTGVELARALRVMSCSDRTRVDASPQAFAAGLRAAAQDDCVNFEGASGPLDFDNAAGEAPNDYTVWCPALDRSGKMAFRDLEGVYYDMKSTNILGVVPNPLPFCPAAR